MNNKSYELSEEKKNRFGRTCWVCKGCVLQKIQSQHEISIIVKSSIL